MEFQSTFPARKPTSHKCIVYDARDGRVVLVHESARKQVPSPEHLKALHTAPEFAWDPHALYRVDVETGNLKVHGKMPRHGPTR